MSFEDVKTQALTLPLKERAALAEALLKTLAAPSQEELAALWVEEAERRLRLVEEGNLPVVMGEEARGRVRDVP
ncbi:Putative addiction module component CHP02574 family protein [Truepera radiovictrix DSM 17093]|uniref:Addiction module component CHP02574 family protein n=2 Tax=Truepera TaxID=332248 RepID=D7CY43_TRURR|nr:Putative addiction module component CHP02574 family protein [Truepera radiovictrix DSM 17093]